MACVERRGTMGSVLSKRINALVISTWEEWSGGARNWESEQQFTLRNKSDLVEFVSSRT